MTLDAATAHIYICSSLVPKKVTLRQMVYILNLKKENVYVMCVTKEAIKLRNTNILNYRCALKPEPV